jgi:hypothetical protein
MAAHYHQAHAAALQRGEPSPTPSKTPPAPPTEPVNVDKVTEALTPSTSSLSDKTRLTTGGERPLTAIHARAAKKAR